jgi:hypothetical protein
LFWALAQLFAIPFRTLLYGMEILLESMRSMQSAGDQGMRVMLGSNGERRPPPLPEPRPCELKLEAEPPIAVRQAPSESARPAPEPTVFTANANPESGQSEKKESRAMDKDIQKENTAMDKDLQDDDLKLVRYKILFVKRDYETAFEEKEELVYDNMTGDSFASWKVAQFIQALKDEKVKVSGKWDAYHRKHRKWKHPNPLLPEPDDNATEHEREEWRKEASMHLISLEEDDKKYLRVYYEVLQRFPREKLRYEEEHLEVLREIRDKMPK